MTVEPQSRQSDSAASRLAHFDMQMTVVDHPTDRRRWNGGAMPSEDAHEALIAGVEAFRAALEKRGFEVVRTGYGVFATEIDPDDV